MKKNDDLMWSLDGNIKCRDCKAQIDRDADNYRVVEKKGKSKNGQLFEAVCESCSEGQTRL